MTFTQGLLRARSHIVFLLALAAAFTLIIYLDRLGESQIYTPPTTFVYDRSAASAPVPGGYGLTTAEMEAGEIAWRYFENNFNPESGLVNSVDAYTSTTMWDQGSYLLALISAYKLDLIDKDEFDSRIVAAMSALADIPLFDGVLPNKAYSTITLEMTDYNNNPTERGLGWSALDLARLAVPMNIIMWNYPEHTQTVRDVIKHWRFDMMIDKGIMMGARLDANENTELVQEGRIGYEEYAAQALALLAIDAKKASEYHDFLKFVDIYDIDVPTDRRDASTYGAHNYVVSEPFILAALEYGWTDDMQEMAYRVYAAQEARYRNTGQLTAVSEDNIDRPPYFVYNTVFSNGKPWNTISEEGDDVSELRSISTKAVFGWDALYDNRYTDRLMDKVLPLHDAEKGFYSGWYEELEEPNIAITANANGIILQSLHYKAFGPLVAFYDVDETADGDDASDSDSDEATE